LTQRGPDELRERAVRLVDEARRESGGRRGAVARIAARLDINPETLRNWVRAHDVDTGQTPGTTTADTERIRELEREVRELRRTNEILTSASAYFAAAELDRRLR
jgi:transposase